MLTLCLRRVLFVKVFDGILILEVLGLPKLEFLKQRGKRERAMGKILSNALLLGIIGLVVGYFLFGKVGNSYIGLKTLLMPSDSLLSQIGNTLRGVETIRQNILLSGGAGAVVGAVTGALRSR